MQKAGVILVAVLGVVCNGRAELQKISAEASPASEESPVYEKNAAIADTTNELLSLTDGLITNASSALSARYAADQQAIYSTQSTLSQEAIDARDAVLAKEIAYAGLEQLVENARKALEDEFIQYKIAERSAFATKDAATAAEKQISSLTETLKIANAAAEQALNVAEEAANEFASQSAMVSEAQERLISATSKWHAAQDDYKITKDAVDKATAAAKQAEENANNARINAEQNLKGTEWRDRLEELGIQSSNYDLSSSNFFRDHF